MLTIAGVKYTLSEVFHSIKANPATPCKKGYANYLMKINGSGATTFLTNAELIEKLENYVENEPEASKLAIYRGTGPGANSALTLDPIKRDKVKADDVAAIAHILTTGTIGNGITNKSTHATDPETGSAKGGSVTVSEFYVNGAGGRRVTKRTEGTKTTYYYSATHAFNTYKYQRLI